MQSEKQTKFSATGPKRIHLAGAGWSYKNIIAEGARFDVLVSREPDKELRTPQRTLCGLYLSFHERSENRVLPHDDPRACRTCVERRAPLRLSYDYLYVVEA